VPLRGVAPFPLVGLDRVASQQPPESITARDWSGDYRKARPQKIPPSGGTKHYLACRAGGATKGTTASSPESGAISHRRAGFASEKRGECTPVLDPSGERSKARSGKARSLREHKKMEPIIGIDKTDVVRRRA